MANEEIKAGNSIKGFIITKNDLSVTRRGDPMFKAWVGQRRAEQVDGEWIEHEPSRFNLVQYGKKALESHAKFEPGDRFIADGYEHPTSYTNKEGEVVEGKEWVAYDMAHSAAQNDYVVVRKRRERAPQQDAAGTEHAQEQAAPEQHLNGQETQDPPPPEQQGAPPAEQHAAPSPPPEHTETQQAHEQGQMPPTGERTSMPEQPGADPAQQHQEQAPAQAGPPLANIPSGGATHRQEPAAAGHHIPR